MNDEVCSAEHAERLRKLHERDPRFGVIGHLWADKIVSQMIEGECKSILDYGCGRSNLVPRVVAIMHELDYPVYKRIEYDPAVAPCTPEPCDFVSCIDVMEHVEADKVDAVLSHIRSLMLKRGIITISLRLSSPKKRLTHPNVWKREKWIERLHQHFFVDEIQPLDPTKAASELAVLVEPIP